MARIISFDRDRALESAMLLFWKQGFADTSIHDLEKAMNLKRTSIYNAFGNKRSLFQQSLIRYLEVVLVRFVSTLEEGSTAKQSINNILNEAIKLHFNPNNPGGCMVVLSLLENNQHDEETNLILNNALRQLRDAVIDRLKRCEKDDEFSRLSQPKVTANQVVALITGLIVMAKANFTKTELNKLIEYSVRSILD